MPLPRFPLLAVLGVLAVAVTARAGEDPQLPIRDGAGLFSPEARLVADKQLAELRDVYHLDVVLETVAAPPEDMRKQVAAMKAPAAAQYFKTWGAQRAGESGVDGVHVLICVDPGFVQVTVQPDGHEREFTAYDGRRLQSRLKTMKKGPENVKQRDAKLLAAVDQVWDGVRYNLRPPFPWLAVGGVIAGALGLWGVLGLVRLRMRKVAAELPESQPLGLYNGLLGAMFGSVAGHWIYDTLFIAASRSRAAEETAAPMPQAAAEVKTDEALDAVEPTPEQARAERMDLTARDHSTEEEPSTPAGAPS